MKIDKYDMALANAATRDESRPILTQICFKDGRLAVSGGYILVCRKADTEKDDGFEGEVLIPAKMAKVIKPTDKKPARMTIKDKVITTTYYNESGKEVDPKLQFKADLNTEFPKFTELFPKGKKYYQYAIGIGLLRELISCLPKDGILRLGFMEDCISPMEFRVSGNVSADYDCARPIYGLVMPMVVPWDEPIWVNEKVDK